MQEPQKARANRQQKNPAQFNEKYLSDVSISASDWITSADGKAAAIMTIAGVVLGLLFLAGPQGLTLPAIRVLYCFFVATALLTVIAASCALWPRTNRKKILRKQGKAATPLDRSPSYFGDVASRTLAEFCDNAREPEERLLADNHVEQIYVLAVIAKRKMLLIRISIALLVIALLSLASLATITLFYS